MTNFDRQYRFAAGEAGGKAFEIGEPSGSIPMPLRIQFDVEKTDLETPNTGKISIWNLSQEHIAELEKTNCTAMLNAGYASRRPLVISGLVIHCVTEDDGADRRTDIEVEDSLINLRDTYVTISYSGKTNAKTILDDVANQMGVAVTYSYNAEFADIPNGYAYVGQGRNVLTKICNTSNLTWSLQNGILQIKKPGDTLSQEVFVLSADTGMVGSPKRFTSTATDDSKDDDSGWEVDYLMNVAINVDDYVYLDSKKATGYFRVYSLKIAGDTHGNDWICTAKLVAI